MPVNKCLYRVLTGSEAAKIWGLGRNVVNEACRRGALRGRKSENIWIVTVGDMLEYQRGRWYPEKVPDELKEVFIEADRQFRAKNKLL